MTAISSSGLISEATLHLRDVIGSLVTDPLSGLRASNDKFVMTSYPERTVTYPIITIKPDNMTSEVLGLSSDMHRVNLPFEIRVWARNQKEKDSIAQDIYTKLRKQCRNDIYVIDDCSNITGWASLNNGSGPVLNTNSPFEGTSCFNVNKSGTTTTYATFYKTITNVDIGSKYFYMHYFIPAGQYSKLDETTALTITVGSTDDTNYFYKDIPRSQIVSGTWTRLGGLISTFSSGGAPSTNVDYIKLDIKLVDAGSQLTTNSKMDYWHVDELAADYPESFNDKGLFNFKLNSTQNIDEQGKEGVKSKIMNIQFLYITNN